MKSSACPRSSPISTSTRSWSDSTTVPTVPAGQRPDAASSSTTSSTACWLRVPISRDCVTRSRDVDPSRHEPRRTAALNDPNCRDGGPCAVEAIHFDDQVIEDSERCDPSCTYRRVENAGLKLLLEEAPIFLFDGQCRREDASLVASAWVIRIEYVPDELLGRDDGARGAREAGRRAHGSTVRLSADPTVGLRRHGPRASESAWCCRCAAEVRPW